MSEEQESELGQNRKPGTFQKGDPRINRAGAPRKDVSDDAVPQLLQDLRHVYNRPKSADKTPGQRMLRKLFEDNPDKFIYRLQKAEGEFRPCNKPTPAEEVEKVDGGSEKVLKLLKSLKDDIEAKRAAEDAEFARRPDAAQIGATLQTKLQESLRREEVLRNEIEKMRGNT